MWTKFSTTNDDDGARKVRSSRSEWFYATIDQSTSLNDIDWCSRSSVLRCDNTCSIVKKEKCVTFPDLNFEINERNTCKDWIPSSKILLFVPCKNTYIMFKLPGPTSWVCRSFLPTQWEGGLFFVWYRWRRSPSIQSCNGIASYLRPSFKVARISLEQRFPAKLWLPAASEATNFWRLYSASASKHQIVSAISDSLPCTFFLAA